MKKLSPDLSPRVFETPVPGDRGQCRSARAFMQLKAVPTPWGQLGTDPKTTCPSPSPPFIGGDRGTAWVQKVKKLAPSRQGC